MSIAFLDWWMLPALVTVLLFWSALFSKSDPDMGDLLDVFKFFVSVIVSLLSWLIYFIIF
jgi:hypothetical protein